MAVDHGIRNETKIGRLVSDSLGGVWCSKAFSGAGDCCIGVNGRFRKWRLKNDFCCLVVDTRELSLSLFIYMKV